MCFLLRIESSIYFMYLGLHDTKFQHDESGIILTWQISKLEEYNSKLKKVYIKRRKRDSTDRWKVTAKFGCNAILGQFRVASEDANFYEFKVEAHYQYLSKNWVQSKELSLDRYALMPTRTSENYDTSEPVISSLLFIFSILIIKYRYFNVVNKLITSKK